jgi:hypothetical protein
LEAALTLSDEFCPNCGQWVSATTFNFNEGFCLTCSKTLASRESRCTICRRTVSHRTMCKACSLETWYIRHGDEVEYLVVTKGYTVAQARQTIQKMIRPICNCCGSVIRWGTPGETLFCKSNKQCHSARNRYNRLISKGATPSEALAQIRGTKERKVTYSGRFIAVGSSA